MKIHTISNIDSDELGKEFIETLNEFHKNDKVIVHVSTFYNTIDEEHKALIVYED